MDAELKDLYISDLQFPVKNFVLCQQQKTLPKRKGPFQNDNLISVKIVFFELAVECSQANT
jgi:hypothetical protein